MLSRPTLEALAKAHVKSLEDEAFMSMSDDALLVHYEGFFAACAPVTPRLRVSDLEAVGRSLYRDAGAELVKHWAKRTAAVFSAGRARALRGKDFTRMHPAGLARVLQSFLRAPASSSGAAPAAETGRRSVSIGSSGSSPPTAAAAGAGPPLIQTAAQISAMWGMPVPRRRPTLPTTEDAGPIAIISSQECLSPSPASPTAASVHEGEADEQPREPAVGGQGAGSPAGAGAGAPVAAPAAEKAVWVDPCKMVLMHEGQAYPLQKGEDGFCVAVVGARTLPTEVPNLLLDPPPPKPAAVRKRPAAAPKGRAKRAKAEAASAEASDAPIASEAEAEGEGEEQAEEEGAEDADPPTEAPHEEEEEVAAGPGQVPGPEEGPGGEGPAVAAASREPAPSSESPPPLEQCYHKMFYKAPRNCWALRQRRGAKRQIAQIGLNGLGLTAAAAEPTVDACLALLNRGRLSEGDAKGWCLARLEALKA